MQALSDFVNMSQKIGQYPEFVQGGGGNTSVKLNTEEMVIKASGFELKQVEINDGFTVVNYNKINMFLNNISISESDYTAFIRSQILKKKGIPYLQPSMETGFHAVLDKVVIHTHSVYANILTCAKSGQEWVKKLFPKAAWIPYTTPGLDLTQKIKEQITGNRYPTIFFLENHGLIVHASEIEHALECHDYVNQTIKDTFKIDSSLKHTPYELDLNVMRSHVLFPDQVVYTESDDLKDSSAGKETISAYYFILNHLKSLQLDPHFIAPEKVKIVSDLDSETYRKGIAKR